MSPVGTRRVAAESALQAWRRCCPSITGDVLLNLPCDPLAEGTQISRTVRAFRRDAP
jgi:hypothetical protein